MPILYKSVKTSKQVCNAAVILHNYVTHYRVHFRSNLYPVAVMIHVYYVTVVTCRGTVSYYYVIISHVSHILTGPAFYVGLLRPACYVYMCTYACSILLRACIVRVLPYCNHVTLTRRVRTVYVPQASMIYINTCTAYIQMTFITHYIHG